jgi:regulatory protein
MKKAQPTTSGITTRMRGVGSGVTATALTAIQSDLTRADGRGQCGVMGEETRPVAVDAALIERWALAYVGRFASTAENLRRVLRRRVQRRLPEDRSAQQAAGVAIDALVARYRASGLVDDAAYAAGRARSRLRRGQSLRTIRAGLVAKGVAGEDANVAIAALRNEGGDPDLAAACAFARRRRLGPYRRAAADSGKELAAFARAGFSRAVATAVLDCATPEEAEALARGDLDEP